MPWHVCSFDAQPVLANMPSARDNDPPKRPALPAHRALTLSLDPKGTLQAVVRSSELDADVPLRPGDTLATIAAAITYGDVQDDQWTTVLKRLQADPTLTVTFDVPAAPTRSSTAPMARTVTAIPVAGRGAGLVGILLRIAIAQELGGSPQPDEQDFRFLAETLPALLWMARADGSMEYMSPNWATFTGQPVEQLKSEGYHSIIHPADLGTMGVLEAHESDDGEYSMRPFRIRRHDGAYRWVEVSLRAVRDPDGALLRTVGITVDVTARREAELARLALNEQLRAAVSVSGMGRYELDLRGNTATGDLQTCAILGIEPGGEGATLATNEVLELVHPEDARLVQDALADALAGSSELNVECRVLRPGDQGPEVRSLGVRGRVERVADGSLRLYGVLFDVTEQRAEDAARLRSQKREAIGTLAGGIAHDFNNVISAIWSNASVAQTELRSGASPATSIEEIRRGAERAAAVVRRLLSFSREEEPERVPFDLLAVAREACELVRPTLAPGVVLHAPPQAPLPAVLGSSGQLHQVIVNLLGNAGHAAADGGGHVWVKLDVVDLPGDSHSSSANQPANGRYVRLRVRDDGPGIPLEAMPRIYDPFFTTKAAGEGTGLGLAAAQVIVHGHGGDLTAENLPTGRGAEFTVVLPASDDTAAQNDLDEGRAAPPAASRSERNDPRVLFVDDSAALARLAERALPLHGCVATSFTSAEEALAALSAHPMRFDAAVVDLSMPGMTGLQFVEAARQIRPDLALILSSGYVTDANRQEAERLGVGAILPKPCSIEAIAAAVVQLTADRVQQPGGRTA